MSLSLACIPYTTMTRLEFFNESSQSHPLAKLLCGDDIPDYRLPEGYYVIKDHDEVDYLYINSKGQAKWFESEYDFIEHQEIPHNCF